MPINVKANGKFVGTWPNTIKEVRIVSTGSDYKFTVSNGIATVQAKPVTVAPTAPTYTKRKNVRYISSYGNDVGNSGSKENPWRTVQAALRANLIPEDTEIRFMGSEYYLPENHDSVLDSFGNKVAIPSKLTFMSDSSVCNLIGAGNGNAMQFWYPSRPVKDIEIYGLQFSAWSLPYRAGGVSPITLAGDFEGFRILNNTFLDNGFQDGGLDHDLYIAGGLSYDTAARNILVENNVFKNTKNQDYRIKIGSGGPGTAGPFGGQNIGSGTHHIIIRNNTFTGNGWGAIIVNGEFSGPAHSEISKNYINLDNTNLKDYLGNPVASDYGGPIYFTWPYNNLRGCDSTFVVKENKVNVKYDQRNWKGIYVLDIHTPTLENNEIIMRT